MAPISKKRAHNIRITQLRKKCIAKKEKVQIHEDSDIEESPAETEAIFSKKTRLFVKKYVFITKSTFILKFQFLYIFNTYF